MNRITKLFALALVMFGVNKLTQNEPIQVNAAETSMLATDFKLSFSYTTSPEAKYYEFKVDFADDVIKQNYANKTLEYNWVVSGTSSPIEVNKNVCKLPLTDASVNVIQTVNVEIIDSEDTSNKVSFTKYYRNGNEVEVVDVETNKGLLPYFYVPIIAILCLVGYITFYKGNSLTGGLEYTQERLDFLQQYKTKIQEIITDTTLDEKKKKKQLVSILRTLRTHIYTIRRIISNMSFEQSIDNTDLLKEANTTIEALYSINPKKLDVTTLANSLLKVFEKNIDIVTKMNKKTMESRKRYLKSTYGI